jgi:hypothetical protein
MVYDADAATAYESERNEMMWFQYFHKIAHLKVAKQHIGSLSMERFLSVTSCESSYLLQYAGLFLLLFRFHCYITFRGEEDS